MTTNLSEIQVQVLTQPVADLRFAYGNLVDARFQLDPNLLSKLYMLDEITITMDWSPAPHTQVQIHHYFSHL